MVLWAGGYDLFMAPRFRDKDIRRDTDRIWVGPPLLILFECIYYKDTAIQAG